MKNDELVQNMLLELRRGVIAIAVLSQLSKEEYGYSLLKALSDRGWRWTRARSTPCSAASNHRDCCSPSGELRMKPARGATMSSAHRDVPC